MLKYVGLVALFLQMAWRKAPQLINELVKVEFHSIRLADINLFASKIRVGLHLTNLSNISITVDSLSGVITQSGSTIARVQANAGTAFSAGHTQRFSLDVVIDSQDFLNYLEDLLRGQAQLSTPLVFEGAIIVNGTRIPVRKSIPITV